MNLKQQSSKFTIAKRRRHFPIWSNIQYCLWRKCWQLGHTPYWNSTIGQIWQFWVGIIYILYFDSLSISQFWLVGWLQLTVGNCHVMPYTISPLLVRPSAKPSNNHLNFISIMKTYELFHLIRYLSVLDQDLLLWYYLNIDIQGFK